jgi:hypothetical protein
MVKNMNSAYCDMEDTDSFFNNKKVYKCKYCGLTLALEDPKTKMLCFKKMVDMQNLIHQANNSKEILVETTPEIMKDMVFESIKQKDEPGLDSCTDDQIQSRLDICNSCDHYKDNACDLCGCRIVRDNNYMNKLAHKSASCPINKWGPIT